MEAALCGRGGFAGARFVSDGTTAAGAHDYGRKLSTLT